MKIFAIFVVVLAATQRSAEQTNKQATLPLRERVALLKYKIAQEIEKNKKHDEEKRYQIDVSASLERLEYVDLKNKPITPINENDERKKYGRFRLRELKTTTEVPWVRPKPAIKRKTTKAIEKKKRKEIIVADDLITSSEEHIPKLVGIDAILNLPTKNKPIKTLRNVKLQPLQLTMAEDVAVLPSNIFYRRIFEGDLIKHCSRATVHCTDLITPVLTGQKINITDKKVLTHKDHEVSKLLHLLSEDTSDLTKDEIYSNLYQISNLQIRLFQWNIASLKMLFNVLTRGVVKRHTWKTLKVGLKRMLASWHLDFANVTNLLHQARIFRPPCIASNNAGSTQSSKFVRYTKKVKPKCSETENSGSCELA